MPRNPAELDRDIETYRTEAKAILDRADGDLSGPDAQRFDELTTQLEQARAEQAQRDNALADIHRLARSGDALIERGSVQNQRDDDRPVSARDTAMRSLDRAVQANRLEARGAELVETLVDTGPAFSRSWTARYAVAAGAEDYERAFAKLVGNPTQGHLLWTPAEAEAYRAVEALRIEQRAMSLTDAAGGYMVPLTLDPAIMLTSNGSTNPLRQISRVVQTSTDSWNGVTSAGVTAEWTAEAAEVADASPTLGQPSIPVHKGDAFVPFSFEIEGDAIGFMSELGKLLQDGADQLSATAYTTGTGTGQPKGIITALVAASTPIVTGDGTEALAASDVFKVQNALPARFQPNAAWNANLSVLNTLRQFETSNGALKFPELNNNPPVLLGRAMHENSNMDGVVNAAATEANYLLLYGAFQQFVIVDRLGSTLELVPHLFGSNRRPTGQRGALLWFRTGSDVVVPNAFRLLNVATTA
ncbi:phage major capsid protein [Nocardia amamiensis]|uniref:phage major capsid protein n=1 Tax=Nocardia amamiensis TaxID=404578 RepID=UPI0034109AD9